MCDVYVIWRTETCEACTECLNSVCVCGVREISQMYSKPDDGVGRASGGGWLVGWVVGSDAMFGSAVMLPGWF